MRVGLGLIDSGNIEWQHEILGDLSSLHQKFVASKATFSAIGSKSYQAVGVWLGYELDDTGKYDVYTTLTYNGAYWGNLNLNVIKKNNRFDICCFNTGDGATDSEVTVSYLIVRNDL